MYTAYRDSDTILNSSDLVSGLFEYMRKGGGTGSIEVSCSSTGYCHGFQILAATHSR